jgi:hypothetical protein
MNPRVLSLLLLGAVAVAVTVALIVRSGEGEPEAQGVRIGFDVLDADCGFKSVVTTEQSIPPQEGEFCLVRVNITNQGDQPVRLDPACQYLISAAGQRYAPRPDVLGADPASTQAFQQPIGAGQLVEDAGLYYDVPSGTKAATAELHAVCDGDPTRVEL